MDSHNQVDSKCTNILAHYQRHHLIDSHFILLDNSFCKDNHIDFTTLPKLYIYIYREREGREYIDGNT